MMRHSLTGRAFPWPLVSILTGSLGVGPIIIDSKHGSVGCLEDRFPGRLVDLHIHSDGQVTPSAGVTSAQALGVQRFECPSGLGVSAADRPLKPATRRTQIGRVRVGEHDTEIEGRVCISRLGRHLKPVTRT